MKNLLIVVAVLSLTGCANLSMRQQNAAMGAGLGGVAGAILTGGSAFGTVGGAAIGGIIGNGGIGAPAQHTTSKKH